MSIIPPWLYKIIHNLYFLAILSVVIFFVIAYSYNPIHLSDGFDTLLGIASFLFGFYVVSAISTAKSQHESVMSHLKDTEGMLVTIHGLINVFDDKSQKIVLDKIDNYLIQTIDYKLEIDYDKSSPSAIELLNTLQSLKPKNEQQKTAQSDSIAIMEDLLTSRALIETSTKDRISIFEWLIISMLFCVILFFVFSISKENAGILLIILKSIVASSLLMMLIVLYRYDTLKWGKNEWVWKRLTVVFINLGLKPYFPDAIFKYEEATKPKGMIRIASYPNKYPDMTGKVITIEVVK